jgi:hypothetical protein
MQTMDMIIMKKKRLALAKREMLAKSSMNKDRGGIWGMIKSVATAGSGESILSRIISDT